VDLRERERERERVLEGYKMTVLWDVTPFGMVDMCQTARRYIPANSNINAYRCENPCLVYVNCPLVWPFLRYQISLKSVKIYWRHGKVHLCKLGILTDR
jgi:hypothetical protein